MGVLLSFIPSVATLFPFLIIAAFITIAAGRGTRNKYVSSAAWVLESFSTNPAPAGEPAIHITGRRTGLVSWLLANMGMSTRVELTVTETDWILRESSLAGMAVIDVPLQKVEATICGYQRSLLALFFTTLFALETAWTLLAALPTVFRAVTSTSEGLVEVLATNLSGSLTTAFIWLVAFGIAVICYYASKRAVFAVESEHRVGLVFKRSFIEDEPVDLERVEKAFALLNRLVQAAERDVPLSQIPSLTSPDDSYEPRKTIGVWMLVASYIALIVLALSLRWYGAGVTVSVSTDPPVAGVWLDGQYMGASQGAGLSIQHVTREDHSVKVQSQGYQPFEQSVLVGKLDSQQAVDAKLILLNFPFEMYTVPGNSAVSVDGRLLGTSNETGLLQIPRVDWGTHTFVVTHDGYRTASESIEVRGPRGARLVLVNEAEAARQEAEARLREIEVHLDRARAYFRNGQYQDATDECDAVLRIEANNAAAIALKKQIEQTRKILG